MSLAGLVTLSVVSHGHGPILQRLLSDLNRLPSLKGTRVVLTLNLADEELEHDSYGQLHIEVVRNISPRGFGANHNAAFSRCETPWFAVLNPDLRVTDDVFGPLVASGDASGASLLAPSIVNSLGSPEDSVRFNLTPWSLVRRLQEPTDLEKARPGRGFRWYAGMFYFLRSSSYSAVNGFDERYFLYCEDYDLCARMHLLGMTLRYEPEVVVVHDAQRASHRSGKHLQMHLASLARVWLSLPVWRIALAAS